MEKVAKLSGNVSDETLKLFKMAVTAKYEGLAKTIHGVKVSCIDDALETIIHDWSILTLKDHAPADLKRALGPALLITNPPPPPGGAQQAAPAVVAAEKRKKAKK